MRHQLHSNFHFLVHFSPQSYSLQQCWIIQLWTCYEHHPMPHATTTLGCPVSGRDDGSSGCTVELCNLLHAPCHLLCPLCRWMPGILGCLVVAENGVFSWVSLDLTLVRLFQLFVG